MTQPDYNLLEEPWIPVLFLDGNRGHLGIREIFERAHEIADLACDLPTQKMAVQRVLLAICYRVTPVEDDGEWIERWEDGLPCDEIQDYLAEWHDRFFLFGGPRPFMQAPGLHTSKNDVAGLEKIIADVPNGEPFFTTRNGPALAKISAAEAALWLLHVHAYDPSGIRSGAVGDPEVKSGKGYPIGPSWLGQTGAVLLRGRDLAETLLLNVVPSDAGGMDGPDPLDSPCAWESDEPASALRRDYAANPDPRGIGIPRLLTWMSRRVRLVGSREGVTGVVLSQGDKLVPRNMHRYEPMSMWRFSEPQSRKEKQIVYWARKHDPERSFWRAVPGILPVPKPVSSKWGEASQFLPPATVAFHSALSGFGAAPRYIRLEAIGMDYGAQEATVSDVYHDEVTVSYALLREQNEALAYLVDTQVGVNDDVARAVGILGANLIRAAGESGDGAGEGAMEQAKAQFFAAIDGPFRAWLTTLDPNTDLREAKREWHGSVYRIVNALVDELIEGVPRSAITGRNTSRGFMSSGRAEMFFRSALRKIIEIPDYQPTGKE